MAEVRMPKMGDGMEEGTINNWLKKEGDFVKSGDIIAEIETDKASVEVTSYETGVLNKIIVQVGQTVPVGELIALIGDSVGAANGSTAPSAANGTQTASNGTAKPETAPTPIVERKEEPVAVSSGASGMERVKASPLARKMALELGIDLAMVTGSGPAGRIVERDITAYQQSGPKPRPLVETAPTTAPVTTGTVPVTASTTTAEESKPSRMREAIAKRTVQSKQTIPHFYVTMLVEMDRALALLKDLNADATDGKVTVNDIIVKACAGALAKVPEANSTWTADGTVKRYKEAHIGIAVGIDEGLIIPVVRDCHTKTLRQISADAKVLIGKARANTLKPDEYSGGTFSVSNLGMMGVDEFIAIINPPEAAILAIGGIVREPVVVGDTDEIVIRSRMKITISADHRLLDGVTAAKFVQEVKKALEAPFTLLS